MNCSHLVLTTPNVTRVTHFFKTVFSMRPHFENDLFSEFVLTSGFRIAFFKPVGKTLENFSEDGPRHALSVGITVSDVDAFYKRAIQEVALLAGKTCGEPKTHPWGEKSFLLIDVDGNRWEITQSPQESGLLKSKTNFPTPK